jgi:16S rRNA (cytosine967-C5)-methyltransferase
MTATSTARPNARQVALDLLRRIDDERAYANIALPAVLARSGLDQRDRGFATELVYGTTRMRRACDYLVDRFVTRDLDPIVRNVLRLGAYQLHHLDVAPHAAVSATVDLAPARARGFVNAVLRRVATAPVEWPDDATRLSQPDWIVQLLTTDLGSECAVAAMEAMNAAATVSTRDDGYIQDLGSQWVAELVDAQPGEQVADLCAAPGGKATALAAAGARVVAADRNPGRVGLVRENAVQLGSSIALLAADAAQPPFRAGSFDRVLIDAPCSGLGALRRRPDARWRIDEASVPRLAALQRALVDAAVPLLRPGGTLVYSVCTLTALETIGVDEHLASTHPELEPLAVPGEPWQPWGRGSILLPQAADTDGMAILRLRSPE